VCALSYGDITDDLDARNNPDVLHFMLTLCVLIPF